MTDHSNQEVVDYGILRIEPRLLVSRNTSIAIANIISLEMKGMYADPVMKPNPELKRVQVIVGVLTFVANVLIYVGLSAAFPQNAAHYFLVPLLLSLIAAFIAIRTMTSRMPEQVEEQPATEAHSIYVRTGENMGIKFNSPNKETIEAVRQIISDKINNLSDTTVYNVNFKSGDINVGTYVDKMAVMNNPPMYDPPRQATSSESYDRPQKGGYDSPHPHRALDRTIDYSPFMTQLYEFRDFFSHNHHEEHERLTQGIIDLVLTGTPTNSAKRVLWGLIHQLLSRGDWSEHVQFWNRLKTAAGYPADFKP